MMGNEGQATGSESRDNYEAVVLDFLDREMAAAQLSPQGKDQRDELDAIVSDLLKQVMTESDQPQAVKKAAPAALNLPARECKPPKMESSAREAAGMQPDPAHKSDLFEPMDPMLASFMPPRSESSAPQPGGAAAAPEPGFNPFEDRVDPLSEYMRLQENAGTAVSGDAQTDCTFEPSQFESMDDVLAEYMLTPEEPIPAAANAESLETESQSGKSAEGNTSLPEPALPVQETPAPAAVAAQPAPEPECTRTEPADAATGAKPETEGPVKSRTQITKTPESPSLPKKTAAPPAAVFTPPAAHKSKWLLIAAASFCLLAALGVPAYFISGSQPAPAASQSAARASSKTAALPPGPNGETPAKPVLQVSPKYPESAIKNRESASVVLELSINGEGEVVKATPLSGPELFADEAVRAAMKWHYRPASLAGANVASKSRVTLVFNLKN